MEDGRLADWTDRNTEAATYQEIPSQGCSLCPNTICCGRINSLLHSARSIHLFNSSPESYDLRRAVTILSEKLRRQGYRYPMVQDYHSCWLHNKWGVVNYLNNEVAKLAEGMAALGAPVKLHSPVEDTREAVNFN